MCFDDPVLPIAGPPYDFTEVPTGSWFDPPLVSAFNYAAKAGTLFAGIEDFPPGFAQSFTVSTGGVTVGAFGPGQHVDFTGLAGGGVAEFTVSGIAPLVDSADPAGFPLKIAFTDPDRQFHH